MPDSPEQESPVIIQYPVEDDLKFPKWIRQHNDLTWGEKAFLAEIISLHRLTAGKCDYSPLALAHLFHVSIPTIHNWTKKLQSLGFVQIMINLDQRTIMPLVKFKQSV